MENDIQPKASNICTQNILCISYALRALKDDCKCLFGFFFFLFSVALPAGYLKPNKLAQPEGPGVCAQPCSKPNTCYSSGCTVSCCAFQPHHNPSSHVTSSLLPSCPGTCDDSCFPDCDEDCCSDAMQDPGTAGAVAPAPAPPSITCPGGCHFSCYPQCSPQCCALQYVPNPCHASCPAYCAPSCDNACCATRKSLVNR